MTEDGGIQLTGHSRQNASLTNAIEGEAVQGGIDSSGHLINGSEEESVRKNQPLSKETNAMRNVILLLPAILRRAAASQITITGDDMPQPDVTYPLVNAAILDLSLGEISGANATWDASDLTALMDAPLTPVDINDASISAALVFNSPFNSAYQCDFYLPTELPDFGVDLGIPLEGFNNFYQTDGDAYAIAGVGLCHGV